MKIYAKLEIGHFRLQEIEMGRLVTILALGRTDLLCIFSRVPDDVCIFTDVPTKKWASTMSNVGNLLHHY